MLSNNEGHFNVEKINLLKGEITDIKIQRHDGFMMYINYKDTSLVQILKIEQSFKEITDNMEWFAGSTWSTPKKNDPIPVFVGLMGDLDKNDILVINVKNGRILLLTEVRSDITGIYMAMKQSDLKEIYG